MSLQQQQQQGEQLEASLKSQQKQDATASKQQKKKKRKRKYNQEDEDAAILQIQQERYDKLLYTAKKQIHKHAKKCKTFLVQKCIRTLKKQQNQQEQNNSKINDWKELNLDLVVDQSIRQLGLLHANPNPETSLETLNSFNGPTSNPLVITLLQHSQFKSVLEEWNRKVTEYRRWCLQLNERNDKFQETKSKKKKNNEPAQQPTSLFCSLGAEEGGEELDGKDMSTYGPASEFAFDESKKKNRKGQRARRAKARAVEAKKEGRQYQSLNWRSSDEKKAKQKTEESNSNSNSSKKQKEFPAKEPEPEPEKQHPSWVAKQQQSSGIVAFQGTKITFD